MKFVFLNFRQRGKKVKNPNQILQYYCVKFRLICDFMPILDFNIVGVKTLCHLHCGEFVTEPYSQGHTHCTALCFCVVISKEIHHLN